MEDRVFQLSVLMVVAVFIITAFYCWSLFRVIQRVPKDKHQFPSWFIWLFLIPYVGFVFQWIMLPFGIPNTFKNLLSNNADATKAAELLFKIGLGQVIFTTFSFFLPLYPVNQIAGVLGLILWILYWVKIISFKNKYLN